jgi:putative addiction module component (TIGR02574 family)
MERMSATPAEEIMRLPVPGRLPVAEQIWESIRAQPDELPVTDAQRAELDRRLARHRDEPAPAEDARTVLERIRHRGCSPRAATYVSVRLVLRP